MNSPAMLSELLEFRRGFYRPTPQQTVVEWCEANLRLSQRQAEASGPFSTAARPYMREPLEAWKERAVESVTLCWGSQTAKSTTLMAGLAWMLCNEPSPALWLMPTADLGRSFVKTRWKPFLEDCPAMRAEWPAKADDFANLEQHFRRATLVWVGSNSPGNLSSRPIRVVVADEVDKFRSATKEESDSLWLVEERVKSYSGAKRFLTSTPTVEHGRIWQRFLAGDQRRFHIPCPHCKTMIVLLWDQVKWDPGARNDDQSWNLTKVRDSATYKCQKCGESITDSQKVVALRSGVWVPGNANAEPGARSYHLSSLYAPLRSCSWGSLAVRFLKARATKDGLHGFVNGDLAEPWKDELGQIDDFDFLGDRCGEYDFGDPWPEEVMRVFSADRQAKGGEHYWWIVRAFARGGRSRLVAYGRANSLLELEERRKAFNVPASNSVIDSGYSASDVYRFCRGAGWRAFKGDDAEYFLHRDQARGRTVRRLWDTTLVDIGLGQRKRTARTTGVVRLTRWSNPALKDLLAELMRGVAGEWTIPHRVGRDYLKQMSAEHRVEERDKRGQLKYKWHRVRPDNHYFDCELQATTVALICGMLDVGSLVEA